MAIGSGSGSILPIGDLLLALEKDLGLGDRSKGSLLEGNSGDLGLAEDPAIFNSASVDANGATEDLEGDEGKPRNMSEDGRDSATEVLEL